ncbi:hypothetical protein PR048_006299 [Dryococelus australis]|uniref:DUF4817 domain-containing protein n=1 Tax=Dryococelus australis TaxID=614101 RepID=A0ABQ9IAL8_9NEOP|nr:hypothetical protein PR048_006299 [Dryococelus australis]
MFTYDSHVKNGDSVVAAQRLFRRHFNVDLLGAVSRRPSIMKWVAKLRTTGNITSTKSPGASRTVRTEDNRVIAVIIKITKRSAQRSATSLFMGRVTGTDYGQREDFAVQLHVLFPNGPYALFSERDESHSHLNGFVNQQDRRYEAGDNPRQLHRRRLNSPRMTENGVVVTITTNRYEDMINNFLLPQLQRLDLQTDICFQQDRATTNTARISINPLRDLFPDLYRDKPRTLNDAKAAIRSEVEVINEATLERVWGSFATRTENCIREDRRHLPELDVTTREEVWSTLDHARSRLRSDPAKRQEGEWLERTEGSAQAEAQRPHQAADKRSAGERVESSHIHLYPSLPSTVTSYTQPTIVGRFDYASPLPALATRPMTQWGYFTEDVLPGYGVTCKAIVLRWLKNSRAQGEENSSVSHAFFANSFGDDVDSKHVLFSATVVVGRQFLRHAPFNFEPVIGR